MTSGVGSLAEQGPLNNGSIDVVVLAAKVDNPGSLSVTPSDLDCCSGNLLVAEVVPHQVFVVRVYFKRYRGPARSWSVAKPVLGLVTSSFAGNFSASNGARSSRYPHLASSLDFPLFFPWFSPHSSPASPRQLSCIATGPANSAHGRTPAIAIVQRSFDCHPISANDPSNISKPKRSDDPE